MRRNDQIINMNASHIYVWIGSETSARRRPRRRRPCISILITSSSFFPYSSSVVIFPDCDQRLHISTHCMQSRPKRTKRTWNALWARLLPFPSTSFALRFVLVVRLPVVFASSFSLGARVVVMRVCMCGRWAPRELWALSSRERSNEPMCVN